KASATQKGRRFMLTFTSWDFPYPAGCKGSRPASLSTLPGWPERGKRNAGHALQAGVARSKGWYAGSSRIHCPHRRSARIPPTCCATWTRLGRGNWRELCCEDPSDAESMAGDDGVPDRRVAASRKGGRGEQASAAEGGDHCGRSGPRWPALLEKLYGRDARGGLPADGERTQPAGFFRAFVSRAFVMKSGEGGIRTLGGASATSV